MLEICLFVPGAHIQYGTQTHGHRGVCRSISCLVWSLHTVIVEYVDKVLRLITPIMTTLKMGVNYLITLTNQFSIGLLVPVLRITLEDPSPSIHALLA